MKKHFTKLTSIVLSLVLLMSVFAAVPVNTQAATAGSMNSSTGWVTKIDDPDVNGDGVIKVLGLGNSFMMDARQYLTMIFNQVEDSKPFMLASTFYGSCTEQMYINFINNKSTDVVLQTFYSADFPEEEMFIPEGQTGYYNTIEHFVTAADDWDIIVFMSASGGYAAKPSVQTEYKNLIEKMLKKNGNTTPKFAYFMSWAYVEGCTYAGVLANCGGDPMVQYQNIIDSITDNVVGSGLFDFVMPMGTTIQNLRTTYEKNRVNPEYTGVNDNLCRDGFHLDYSLGRWAAALTWASSLGLDISGVEFDETASSAKPIGKIEIKVNDVQTISAKEAVANAIANPTGVTQSKWDDQPYEYPCTEGEEHTYGEVTTYAKTCSEEGYSEKTCSSCGYTYLFDYVDDSHEFESVVTAPTCTMGGYTTHTCTVCDYVTTDTKVKALGHKYVDTVTKKTCTTDGNIHHRCTVCGFEYNDVIEACHEISSWTVVTEATYESTGLKKGICDDCGETITEVIAMLNNDVVYDWDYSNEEDYDETVDNSLKLVGGDKGDDLLALFKYSEGDGVYRVNAPVDAYPYNENNNSVNMPFASYGGFRGFLINTPDNTYANEFTLKGGIGRALHPYGETKKEAAIPGVIFAKDDQGLFTFQVDVKLDGWVSYGLLYVPYTGGVPSGSTTHVKAMKNCTGTYYIESVDGVATQPTYLLSNLNDRGLTGGIEITEDNYYDVQVEYHVSYNNDTGETTIYADLLYDKDGVKWTATCESFTFSKHSLLETYPNLLSSFNHDSYTSAFGMANYAFFSCAEEIFAAGTSGYNTTDVYAINAHYAEGDACNHSTVTTIPAVEATCTTAGSKAERFCAVCDTYLSGGETINALGHNYQVSTAEPTCAVNGITETVCSRCDYSNITETPALGHTYTSYTVDTKPTCTEPGSATGNCSTCGETVIETVEATGHSFGEWNILTEATTSSKGSKERSCTVCGHTETQIIERISTDIIYDFDYSDTENGSYDANTTVDVVTFVDSTSKAANSGSDYHYYNAQSNTFDMVAAKGVISMAVFETPEGYEAYNMHASADVQSYNNASPAPIVLVATNGNEATPVYYMFQLRCVQGSFSYMVWAYKQGASAATSDGAYSMTPVGTGRIHNWVTYKASTVNGVELSPPNANATTLIGKDKLTAYGSHYDIPLTFSYDVTVVDGVPVITPSATYTDETTGESLAFGFDEIVVDKDFLALAETDTLVPAFGFGTTTSDTISAYNYDGLNTGNGDICKYDSIGVTYIVEGSTHHEHTYEEAENVAPTCDEDGYIAYICTDCGNLYTDVVPATGHSYGEYSVLTAASYGKTGVLRKTCSTCGDTSDRVYFLGELECADGHTISEYDVITAATCTEGGERGGLCTVCGQTLHEYNPALGHDYIVTTIDPTCTEAGATVTSCSRCDYRDSVEIPMESHQYAYTTTVKATCEAAGEKLGKCSMCGDTKTEEIPALGHNTTTTTTKEATCTESGTQITTCSRCAYRVTEDIPAKGHQYSYTTTVNATCETAGEKTGECSVCGDTVTEEIAALGHDIKQTVTESTCAEQGSVTEKCSRCSYSVVTSLPLAEHTYGDWVVDVKPAVGKEGSKHRTCSVCGSVETAAIPAETEKVGYSWDFTGANGEADVAEMLANGTHYAGSNQSSSLASDLQTISYNSEIQACVLAVPTKYTTATGASSNILGHLNGIVLDTPKGAAADSFTAVTGSENCAITSNTAVPGVVYATDDNGIYFYSLAYKGSMKAYLYYAVTSSATECDGYVGLPKVAVKTVKTTDTQLDTFIKNGEVIADYDSALNKSSLKYSTIVSTWGSGELPSSQASADFLSNAKWVYDVEIVDGLAILNASCVYTAESGNVYEFVYKGYTADADGVYYTAQNGTVSTTELTSYTDGSGYTPVFGVMQTGYGVGDVQVYSADAIYSIVGEAHEHNWVAGETVDPTCETDGYTVYFCSECDSTYNGDTVAALGHNTTTTTTKAATCTENGVETTTCSRCDYSATNDIAALGHDTTTTTTKAATCTENGVETTTCSRCDHESVEEIPALGHSFSDPVVTKEATCTEDGVKTGTCSVCSETTTEVIPATGHNYLSVVTAPTCTDAGYTTYTCSACNDSYKADETEALGHDYVTSTVEATCSAKGSVTTTCTHCDYNNVVETDMLEHTESDWFVDKEATATTDGSRHTECTVCGAIIKSETIPATGEITTVLYGDANQDGTINISDAVAVARYGASLIDLSDAEFTAADVDGNGEVNVLDAVLISRFSADLIFQFPIESDSNTDAILPGDEI